MKLKVDYALIGTGLAPLIAAQKLQEQGRSFVFLNPNHSFFYEDSELPFDLHFFEEKSMKKKIELNEALDILNPYFPGSVQTWSQQKLLESSSNDGLFLNENLPYLKARDWIYAISEETLTDVIHFKKEEEKIEELYLHLEDLNYQTKILDEHWVKNQFPGMVSERSIQGSRGLLVSQVIDMDVEKYRRGIFNFLKDKYYEGVFYYSLNQLEWKNNSLRFLARNETGKEIFYELEAEKEILFFWTPRVAEKSRAFFSNFSEKDKVEFLPKNKEFWSQWRIISKDPIDLGMVGYYQGIFIYPEYDGFPLSDTKVFEISVFKKNNQQKWCNESDLETLSDLFIKFLKWDKYTIRRMQPREIFTPRLENDISKKIIFNEKSIQVIVGVEGAILQIIENLKKQLSFW